MGSRTPWICAAVGGALSLQPALAEGADEHTLQEGVRIDQSQPAAPESAFFHAEGPHGPAGERVEFAVGLTGDYAFRPIQVRGVDSKGGEHDLGSPVRHAGLVFLGASITPVHWLSFDLSMPFALFESGDTITTKGYADLVREPDAPSVGDIRVGAHVRPIDSPALGLVLGARLWAAIGSELAFLSDARFRFELDIGLAGEDATKLFGCTASIAPSFFAQRNGDRAALACALHRKVAPFFSIGFEPTFAVFTDASVSGGTDYRILLEPLAAGRFRVGDFRFGLGAGPGFGSAPGMATFRALLEAAYVGGGVPEKPPPPPPPDADLDGILDKDDACPKEAGPLSKDPTKNGCPSQDRDADGIRDEEDWCPDRPGIHHQNPNANGCPDSDNDQLPDPIDQCRNEPGAPPSGCPKFARLQHDQFRVDPPILFDGRSPTLSNENRAALEEIAATMRANPKIEQVSVQLGTKGVKADLSDKRAQQIILLLRNANLDSSRFEVVLRDDLKAGNVEVKVIR